MGTIGVSKRSRPPPGWPLRPDVVFVDAPVSGSKGPAEQGQLLILASGPAAAEPVVGPVFAAIGRKTVWLGEAGQGSQLKLVVNAYMSILIEGVAEALELADRLGIAHEQLEEVIEGGRWTRRSPTPSSTRWTRATSPRSSLSSGRSRMWTWPSAPLAAAATCRCSPRCPGSGTSPSMPGTGART